LEAPALHTLRLIARQPWRHCVTSLRSAHWLASSLKLATRCPVSGCWPSCFILTWNHCFGWRLSSFPAERDTAQQPPCLLWPNSRPFHQLLRSCCKNSSSNIIWFSRSF